MLVPPHWQIHGFSKWMFYSGKRSTSELRFPWTSLVQVFSIWLYNGHMSSAFLRVGLGTKDTMDPIGSLGCKKLSIEPTQHCSHLLGNWYCFDFVLIGKLGASMLVATWNPSTYKAEAGGSQLWLWPGATHRETSCQKSGGMEEGRRKEKTVCVCVCGGDSYTSSLMLPSRVSVVMSIWGEIQGRQVC